jgi:hypothetical protein
MYLLNMNACGMMRMLFVFLQNLRQQIRRSLAPFASVRLVLNMAEL